MKRYRYFLYYLFTIGAFSLLMYFIVKKGETMSIPGSGPVPLKDGYLHFRDTTIQNLLSPLPLLLIQLITIIIIARITGYLFRKIGQPSVIGEIVAGIILGPSVLGLLAPGVSAIIFPEYSIGTLNFMSQIGLILFMFIIGMDVDVGSLGKKAPEAFVVSHASIIIPFALGMGLSVFIYSTLAPEGVSFLSFALFTGISMSITAFPILARILQERNMLKTRVGSLAITCAAVDDISAWFLLAALIAIVKAGSFVSSLYTIGLSIVYIFVMFILIKPFLKRLGDIFTTRDGIVKPVIAIFIVTLLFSSYVTEIIGIHSLFGAFVAGVIMPPNVKFRKILIGKVEDLTVILFLPLFFVMSGLRTEIGLIDSVYLLKITLLVILIAVAGKFAGSALSLKFIGEKWRESLIIGALMNTRGLMQLVVLSIGYDLGVLSPEVFTIMIIMALVTTLMTGPALDLIDRFLPEPRRRNASNGKDIFRILISFGNPEKGRSMLAFAYNFIRKEPENARITLLHLSPGYDLHKFNLEEYEKTSFQPVRKEAERLGINVATLFKTSQDIQKDIIDTANSGNYDIIITGKSQSPYEGSLLGRIIQFFSRLFNPGMLYGTLTGREKILSDNSFDSPTRRLLKSIKIPVGIFADIDLAEIKSILIPVYSMEENQLIIRASDLAKNCDANLFILDFFDQVEINPDLNAAWNCVRGIPGINATLISSLKISEKIEEKVDLLFVSTEGWYKFTQDKRIRVLPPAFIIRI